MCGILGVVGRDATAVERAVRGGLAAMSHRGPDDHGLCLFPFGEGVLALAHARLSILDVSPAARQPMVRGPLPPGGRGARVPGGGDAAIVFNGEIYNHKALRAAARREPPSEFATTGDTEVLLAGLVREGEAYLPQLRGMFALAFAEPGRGRLTLVRDRLGIKPLYLAEMPGGLVFASEVRAILATGLVTPSLDGSGLAGWLAYGAAQEPETLVRGVRALPAGHVATFGSGRLSPPRRWWDVPRDVDRTKSRAEWVHDVRATLEEVVDLHLEADVPVGAFLSGGVDSSTLVALMAGRPGVALRTSTVVCEGEAGGEGEYAALVARRYGASHHVETISDADAAARALRSTDAMDLPSLDGANTYVVSESIRRAGCTVALSGLGGDEVFLGYGHFTQLARLSRWASLPGLGPLGRLAGAVAPPHDHRWQRAVSVASTGGELGPLLAQQRRFLFPGQVARLLPHAALTPDPGPPFDPASFEDPLSAASAFELAGYCRNMLLRDSDAMSMAHGLELRVPFLDHVLVEQLLRVPGALKLPRAGVNKPLLVEAVQELLPEPVYRRKKRGFHLDIPRWMRGALRSEVGRTLGTSRLFDERVVSSMWRRFLAGDDHLSPRVWGLFRLARWTQRHLGA